MKGYSVLAIILLGVVFFTCLSGHLEVGMPMHVDSWGTISFADFIIKQQKVPAIEPFSGLEYNQPFGFALFQACTSLESGISLLQQSVYLPAILNVILAMMLYILAKELFDKKIALAVMAFSPLVLSQITMLGPFFLVNLSLGMILAVFTFYLVLKKRWFYAMLILGLTGFVHRSSLVFTGLGLGLYIIFNPKQWKNFLWLIIAGIVSVLVFIIVAGFKTFLTLFLSMFMFKKAWPYFQHLNFLGPVFLILFALGVYYLFMKEQKAAKFLLPLLIFIVLDLALFWVWKGFFLVYRRIAAYFFLLVPLFVGSSVVHLSSIFKKWRIPVFLLLLIILVPLAVIKNTESRALAQIYVTKEEAVLFSTLGHHKPNSKIITGHLEAYAMPYFNLTPVSLSPAHGANTTNFYKIHPCFLMANLTCISNSMEELDVEFLYTTKPINDSRFREVVKTENLAIYQLT